MTTNQPQRYGGLFGVAGGALALGGIFAVSTVEFMPEPADALATFTDDSTRLVAGGQILVISAVLLAAFGAVVHRRLRSVSGSSMLPTAAAAGYIAAAVAQCIGACVLVSGVLRADQDSGITEAQATTLFDIGLLLVSGAAAALLAVGVGATAVASIRNATGLPTWLAWLGVPIAIGCLFLPINWAVGMVAMVWTIVAGVTLSTSSGSVIDVTTEQLRERVSA